MITRNVCDMWCPMAGANHRTSSSASTTTTSAAATATYPLAPSAEPVRTISVVMVPGPTIIGKAIG